MKDETLRSTRLADKHPKVFEIDSISLIDDEIAPLQCSLIFPSLIGIEMVRNGSTTQADA
jgi:hypothetical protein